MRKGQRSFLFVKVGLKFFQPLRVFYHLSPHLKSTLQQAARHLSGKEFCGFYIRSLFPQQAAGNKLAVAGQKEIRIDNI
jgi:hypothetical protein